jgi:hypothetical protein
VVLQLGQSAEAKRSFAAADISDYLALARHQAPPGEVPEPLIGAMFSYLLGVKLPGKGTNYLKQQSDFMSPAYLGEMLTARVEVTRLRPEKSLVDLRTTCRNDAGDLICDGRALVYIEDVTQ